MNRLNALVVVLLTTLVASAQQAPKFGLKGGLNLSKLFYNNGGSTDWRTGFNAGGLAHVHVTPSFSLQPEIYYSSQGAKIPFGNTDDKVNRNLSYINIPILLQYNFANGFRLQGGPQAGFLVGANDKLNGEDINSITTDDFKTFELALPLGLSYLGYSGLGIDVRYNIGLTDIDKSPTYTTKSGVFQLGAFYLFDHRHKVESSKKKKRTR